MARKALLVFISIILLLEAAALVAAANAFVEAGAGYVVWPSLAIAVIWVVTNVIHHRRRLIRAARQRVTNAVNWLVEKVTSHQPEEEEIILEPCPRTFGFF